MNQLPKALRLSPYAFYVIALIMGVYQFLTNLAVIWQAEVDFYTASHNNAFDWLGHLLLSQPFAVGISEAAYMAANGIIAHLLIAIYDQVKGVAQ